MAPKIVWPFEPTVLVGLAALAAVYLKGWRRARRPRMPHPPGYGRLTLFLLGLAVIYAALASPIDPLADDLLVLHMLQHVLLLDIAPILLILGLTKGILRPVTRRIRAVERRAGYLAHPAFAVALYAGSMWLWHAPAMYDLALRHAGIHFLEHITFMIAGSLYWWYLISPVRSRMRRGGAGPIAYMVSTKLMVGVLGVALAFAPTALYPFYEHQARYWGLSAVDDQSLAGLLMALEQSIVMGIALVVLFFQMLSESERQTQRAEKLELEAEASAEIAIAHSQDSR
ncbi:MAG TPA: cytochrome c oxidase assembly protein [Solirubrobacteraceae bacterium]|nr:cytochrome c oxidase assembly protein [Solirubrobacteraceae bacterium]